MRLASIIAAVAVASFVGSPPAQASEDDRSLSVSLMYGRYAIPGLAPHGGVLGVDFERGFSDALALRVSGGGGTYFGETQSYSGHLTVGVTYLFDVIKYVPYANIGIGGIVLSGGTNEDGEAVDTEISGLIELGFGVDVLHSRSFSYGVLLRFESFVESTAFFTVGARVTWRWGFF